MNSIHGAGLGLRREYYQQIIDERPAVDWFEILSENYLVPGGRPLYNLQRIRRDFPIVMHGVSLSIGGTDPLNRRYLRDLKALIARIEPAWISDHLCWSGVQGVNLHDLMPLPYTARTVRHVVERVQRVQDYLGQQILLENVSSYLTYRESEMSEWEFLSAICQQADCYLLLDVNNIYVSGSNHEFNPIVYLDNVPATRVRQIHLAGHRRVGSILIDTHDAPVCDAVWQLYAAAVARFGAVPTMIERDANMPKFEALMSEMARIRNISTSRALAA